MKTKKVLKTADMKAYKRAWDLANKSRIKAYRINRKLEFYIVYTIDNYDGKGSNYCGVTRSPDNRMCNHKSTGKLNVDNFTIVATQVDRADAVAIEREYHAQGYDGAYGWKLKKEAV